MKKPLLLCATLLLTGTHLPASATVRYDLTTADAAIELNQQAMPTRAVDLLYQLASRGQEVVSRQQVVSRLIENRLLANYARQTYSDNALFEGQRVGFRHDVQMQNELVATLKAGFREPLSQFMRTPAGNPGKAITRHYALAAQDMDRVFGAAGKTLLEYRLDSAQEAAARDVAVLAYRFAGGAEKRISLLDIYACQNVQGRVMLYSRDTAYIKQQAELLLENRFIVDWAVRRSGLGPQDIAFLRQAIEDRAYRDELMHFMGLEQEAHEGTAYLTQLAAQVTPAEVHAYYESHKDEFRQIDQVKARHIVLATEGVAQKVSESLQKGGNFAELARQYSVADDKASGGDMGWLIYHRDRALPWIQQLAFIQKPGVASRPVRSPGSNGQVSWEIVMVDERIESFQAEDSHEVQFAASEAIAHQKAVENFDALRQKLVAAAEIRVNPAVLPAGSLPL